MDAGFRKKATRIDRSDPAGSAEPHEAGLAAMQRLPESSLRRIEQVACQ
jgi:hypothetical protein